MKKERSTIDGFVPRKSGDMLGGLHGADKKTLTKRGGKKAFLDIPDGEPAAKLLHTTGSNVTRDLGQADPGRGLGRSDITDSLNEIDNFNEPVHKMTRRERKLLKKQSKIKIHKPLWSRIVKWTLIAVLVGLLSIGGYAVYKFVSAGTNIFQGSIFDIFKTQALQQDANGRSNFLVVGTSEDDPGHEGAGLTDSMVVVSIDQTKKDAYMFSIPRDMLVEYGRACPEGYSGKVNSYFSCISDGSTPELEQERLSALRQMIGDISGLDIQYAVHVNWQVLREAVDAVGGVDVDVQGSNGAPGVLDRNADWRCNYTCYYVKYDNGVHHMDGEHALYFAMARGHDEPTYGLSRSNPDRELNQQKVMIALKDRATSTGFLTNLGAISKMIDALGSNLRTNIQSSEVRTLAQLANDVKTGDIRTLNFIDGDKPTIGSDGNPLLGVFQYDDIQAFIEQNLTSDPVSREAAPVAVFNGSGQSGLGKTEADKLTEDGLNVVSISTAPEDDYGTAVVYQIGDGNDATAGKLAEKLGVTVLKTKPPVVVNGNVRFVVIFGAATS